MAYHTKIDWCDSSWNPVTGCNHGCEYCYARGIAERFSPKPLEVMRESDVHFEDGLLTLDAPVHRYEVMEDGLYSDKGITVYPLGFVPTFHKYRLDIPKKWSEPRTIFVCSMADLFGKWVPDEWIEEVFKACKAAPQHRYLFLTKNPTRYLELADDGKLPMMDNFWYGSTATTADDRIFHADMVHTFVSVEPILQRIDCSEKVGKIAISDWIIVGAETGKRKDKVIPDRAWIQDLAEYAASVDVPIFMKESVRDLMGADFKQQFPWQVDSNEKAGR